MFGLVVMEDGFWTSLRRVDGKPQICWVVFLFQSLKEAVDVAEDHGTVYPKKCFQNIIPYSVVANSDITLLKVSFLQSRSKKSCYAFWQRNVLH